MWIKCSICQKLKPLYSFSRDKKFPNRFGCSYVCKMCMREEYQNRYKFSQKEIGLSKTKYKIPENIKTAKGWSDRDILEFMGTQFSESLHSGVRKKYSAVSVSLEEKDFKKMDAIKGMFGKMTYAEITRISLRLLFHMLRLNEKSALNECALKEGR
jgi:superfamily II helicase